MTDELVPAPEGRQSPSESRGTPEWAEFLVRFLDDGWRVPGTSFHFGLDAVLGLVMPGVGDVLSALCALALLVLAVREHVPRAVLGRMLLNIAVDAVAGAVPVVGDLFDVAYKSNRRNLELIQKTRAQVSSPASARDYVLMGLAALLALCVVLLPLAVIWWLSSVWTQGTAPG